MANSAGKQVGQQLGNYRLLRLQAQDSFADIYLGEHVFLKTQATIKVVQAALTGEELESFLAEVRVIARLKHSNIVRVLEFGVEGAIPFLVTDYAPNGSLRQLHPDGSLLPAITILDYVRQIAAALQYVHNEHLVHGNLRPENILLGSQNQPLLSDFGTVALDQDTIPTHIRPATGQNTTVALDFRAPEQLVGKSCPDSDQYALAVIVYEWLNGHHPPRKLSGDTIDPLPSAPTQPLGESALEVAPTAEQVILKALAKEPERRFATVSDFAHALEQALQPPAKPIQQPSDLQRRPARKFSASMISALIALVVLAVGGSGLFTYMEFFSPSKSSSQGISATATALARLATANATFSGLSVQDIYARVTSGKPVINDPLNNQAGSTWKDERLTTGTSISTCTFSNGAYSITSADLHHMNCLSSSGNFSNFALQVEMTIVKGDLGGICFRTNSSGAEFYHFGLHAADGSYLFSADTNAPYSLLADGTSSFIKPGLNQTYLITVIAVGSHFYFYVNTHFIIPVIDPDNTFSSGKIGLTAGSNTSPATEVIFRNVQMWKL